VNIESCCCTDTQYQKYRNDHCKRNREIINRSPEPSINKNIAQIQSILNIIIYAGHAKFEPADEVITTNFRRKTENITRKINENYEKATTDVTIMQIG
jgi:hypothetical protein